MTADLHHRILTTLTRRDEQRIMNNVCRSDYIECMVASVLCADWRLTWADGWDWAPWDCEHTPTGTRLEIKQAAARQSWDHESPAVRRRPVFDIASRRGYWPRDGGPWIEARVALRTSTSLPGTGATTNMPTTATPNNGSSLSRRKATCLPGKKASAWHGSGRSQPGVA